MRSNVCSQDLRFVRLSMLVTLKLSIVYRNRVSPFISVVEESIETFRSFRKLRPSEPVLQILRLAQARILYTSSIFLRP